MKNKVLVMMGIILMVSAIFGINGRLSANSPTQEDIEHRTVTGTDMEAAVVNGRISYQGYLTNPATGDPLTGSHNMTFSLWDAPSGGTQVGTDIVKNNTAVADGLFNVTLDIPDETFDGQGRWIQLQVGGETLTPRREILPVPYALSLRPGALISGTIEGANLAVVNSDDNGNQTAAIYGRISSSARDSSGVIGRSYATTGQNYGVSGTTRSNNGSGVFGHAVAVTGDTNGVYGISDSPDGNGVTGLNGAGGDGVHGWAWGGDGAGVSGGTDDSTTIGVIGTNSATTGSAVGIYGASGSPDGTAVKGHNGATTGNAVGVFGSSASPDGFGIEGYNGNGGYGIHGWTSGGAGVGVWGGTAEADSIGVMGINNSSGEGVFGSSVAGHGVSGITEDDSDYYEHAGVHGTSTYTRTFGVLGESEYGIGVAGRINNTSSVNPAVMGQHMGSGDGVYAYSAGGIGLYATTGADHIIVGTDASYDWKFSVSSTGNVFADGTYQSPAADFAEMMPAHAGLEAGDVLIIGADGQLTLSVEAYQTSVVGVYSTAPGFLGGAAEDGSADDNIPLAIVGIVPVKVSSENGPIQPGDLLTTSATPGYAMVCSNGVDCIGAIIGKALEPLTEGSGVISVLVTLQ